MIKLLEEKVFIKVRENDVSMIEGMREEIQTEFTEYMME
jgi:hypothetical protein